MRKRPLLLLALLGLCALPDVARACDVCALYPGVLPQDRRHRLELFYRYHRMNGYRNLPAGLPTQAHNLFKTAHGGLGNRPLSPQDAEVVHTWALRGLFFPHSRVSVEALVPLLFMQQHTVWDTTTDSSTTNRTNGLGDVQVLVHAYPLWQERTTGWSHRLGVGLGAKAPTGLAPTAEGWLAGQVYETPGLGTWDVLASLRYSLRRGNWGGMLNAAGRWPLPDANGNRHSPLYNLDVAAFYRHLRCLPKGNLYVVPSLGLYAEANNGAWVLNNQWWVPGTGGNALFLRLGVEVLYGPWGINATWQHPLAQDLLGTQLGHAGRLQLGLSWAFGGGGKGAAKEPALTAPAPAPSPPPTGG